MKDKSMPQQNQLNQVANDQLTNEEAVVALRAQEELAH